MPMQSPALVSVVVLQDSLNRRRVPQHFLHLNCVESAWGVLLLQSCTWTTPQVSCISLDTLVRFSFPALHTDNETAIHQFNSPSKTFTWTVTLPHISSIFPLKHAHSQRHCHQLSSIFSLRPSHGQRHCHTSVQSSL